jgi:pimeloyl-ACP methyl ester carboxylesterase
VRIAWLVGGGLALLVLAFNLAVYGSRGRALQHGAPCDAIDRLGVLRAVWAFAKECVACAAVLLLVPAGWCVPHCRGGAGTRGAIVLLHDWGLNCGSLWLLRRRLVRDGWSPVCCLAYCGWRVDVTRAAQGLRDCIAHLVRSAPQRPVAVVGHGLGGLVLRYYARRYPAPAVRRLVTLGTPHAGTQLAVHVPALRATLAPGAPLLSQLGAADRVPQQFDVIALQSTFDAYVLPPASGEYAGAFNVRVNDVGHHALLFSHKVYGLLAENLAAPLRGIPDADPA